MSQVAQSLVQLIPQITHPLALIAFTVFVVLFLLVKMLLRAGILPMVTQHHGFRLLNKVLNIAAVALLLIILLGFLSFAYVQFLGAQRRSRDASVVRDSLDRLAVTASTLSNRLRETTAVERLKLFQPDIYRVGSLLETDVAFREIERLRSTFQIPELTPTLLAVSEQVIEQLLEYPFNYAADDPKRRQAARKGRYHGYTWSLGDFDDAQRNFEYLRFLDRVETFPYKEVVFFLLSRDPSSWGRGYERSIVWDAAFYVEIRRALWGDRPAEALTHAAEFVRRFPGHRHTDDAYALQVMAATRLGQSRQAFELAATGATLPDGDMSHWHRRRMLILAETRLTATDLLELQGRLKARLSDVIPALQYIRIHHVAAARRYDEALELLRTLISSRPRICLWRDAGCVTEEDLRRDEKTLVDLSRLARDTSPEGRYRLGLRVFDTELLHYNRLFKGTRSVLKYDEDVPSAYFELRNNYFVSSNHFQAAATTPDLALRQKALYKLARAYQHLAYSEAFFPQTIGPHSRREFATKTVETFLAAAAAFPSGPLADDSAVEAALNTWRLLDKRDRARDMLRAAVRDYSGKNAEDNAVYWLASIYVEEGRHDLALKHWVWLGRQALSARLRAAGQQQASIYKLRDALKASLHAGWAKDVRAAIYGSLIAHGHTEQEAKRVSSDLSHAALQTLAARKSPIYFSDITWAARDENLVGASAVKP